MKIRIEQEFILDSSAKLLQMAFEAAKCHDQRHQIIKALVERFPAVADMDLEDLLQFIAMLPAENVVHLTKKVAWMKDALRVDAEKANAEIATLKAELARATQACEAVADARMAVSVVDGPESIRGLEEAIEKTFEVAYGADRRYPPAIQGYKCTCGHCTQEELARRGGNPS